MYDQEKTKWNRKASGVLAGRGDWKVRKTYDQVFSTIGFLRPIHAFFEGISRPGTAVLDYGCGTGWTTLVLAQKATHVKAFDIAEKQIAVLKRAADANGYDNIEACVADGEAVPYADNEFDYVFGSGVLHHIRLDRCLPEIARVLKPGGRAAFSEPWGHNPLFRAYRHIKHHFIDEIPGTDRPLKRSDIASFQRHFGRGRVVPCAFFSTRCRRFGLPVLERLLLQIPFVRWQASHVTVLLQAPTSADSAPRAGGPWTSLQRSWGWGEDEARSDAV